jgi:hypothetical protein
MEKRPYATQYAALRARTYPHIVQASGKMAQVVYRNVLQSLVLTLQIDRQLAQIEHVGFYGICRHVALQTQIPAICQNHIRPCFLVRIHLFT